MTGRRKSTIVGQFVPHRIDLIESPAWRVLSLSARRVLDRIEIEMCHHGGHRENGKLPVTFDDFVRHAVRRNSVASAIREAVALGLVVVSEQGRGGNAEFRSPNKYRLTYICTEAANPAAKYPDPPTDDWKRIETMDAAEHIAKMARDARNRPSKSTPAERKFATSKKQKSTPQNGTASPPISGVENLTYPPPISGGTGSVTKRGVLSISPEGASASCTLRPSFLGPPARGNLKPTFANPDDATAWFTRMELARHPPQGHGAPPRPRRGRPPKNAVAMTAEELRARQREYNRRHRAKMTDEERAAARVKNREYQCRHLAKKAARLNA
jgi:hypothetical protein